jgi:pimeloyl-ACP methyl ester carboxylesterase
MRGVEETVVFGDEREPLWGVLHEPSTANGAGVVFLHGWPGNRIGPHRMFVTMARRLTAAGFRCLRVDFRGRGESGGIAGDATIRSMIADARCGVDYLTTRGSRHVFLLGICSGGKVAIGLASEDSRIEGLALWSAESMGYLRDPSAGVNKSLEALRIYTRKLVRPETWRKILTFRVNTGMVRKALSTDEAPSSADIADESAMLHKFRRFRGGILLVYGGNDPETKTAAGAYIRFCGQNRIASEFHEIPEANHSFYSIRSSEEVMTLTERWFKKRI